MRQGDFRSQPPDRRRMAKALALRAVLSPEVQSRDVMSRLVNEVVAEAMRLGLHDIGVATSPDAAETAGPAHGG